MRGIRAGRLTTLSAFLVCWSAPLVSGASVAAKPHPSNLKPGSKPLDARLSKLLAAHPAVLRGHLGYRVIDADSGAVLASHGSNEFYTPASNTKLYTTGAALIRLGPNYRFHTVVRAPGRQPGDTTVAELQFVGGGDPNVSGRTLPYMATDKGGDPMASVSRLVDQIVAAHIQTVAGDIVGVDRRYPGDAFPDGWTVDDQLYDYGAPVSSLAVNDNATHLTIRPTSQDDLAEITLSPEVGHFVVLNTVATIAGGSHEIHIARDPGSRELLVSGYIGTRAPLYEEDLAVVDPALFAAQTLLQALRDRGVSVRGSARSDSLAFAAAGPSTRSSAGRTGNDSPNEIVASLDSAPLSQSIAIVNKVSQNLHAEMLLRELGGDGTLKSGVEARQAFLGEAGLGEKDTVIMDGSGLARQNLTTPDATVTLLRFLWRRPEREEFLASLPIGGVDGSLEHRLKSTKGAERIHAKTGSISHVAALSGFVEAKSGRWLIFSIMTNAEATPPGDVREMIDQFCTLLLEQ